MTITDKPPKTKRVVVSIRIDIEGEAERADSRWFDVQHRLNIPDCDLISSRVNGLGREVIAKLYADVRRRNERAKEAIEAKRHGAVIVAEPKTSGRDDQWWVDPKA